MNNSYEIFGFAVRSELPIPEAQPVELGSREADVTVAYGEVPEFIGPPGKVRVREIKTVGILIEFENVARYQVRVNGYITIDVLPGATLRMVRTVFLGLVFATFMHRRGFVPLHVSALDTPNGLIAFSGGSGAGKSTTAAVLNSRTGWPIFCDDVAMVAVKEGNVRLHCGLRRLKLWRQKIEMLGLDRFEQKPDLFREDKFHVLAPGLFAAPTGTLRKLVLISRTGTCEWLGGAEKFFGVRASVYRPEVAQVLGDPVRSMKVCADVADAIEAHRFNVTGVLENDDVAVHSLIEECVNRTA